MKIRLIVLLAATGWMAAGPHSGWASDLILKGKSDSAVKPLVFPLSMTVLQNRPAKGLYYFFDREEQRFDDGLDGNPAASEDAFDRILSDPKIIKKRLVSADPVRINPSSRGEDFRGSVTREMLKKLGKTHSADILLVFRREVSLFAGRPVSPTVFLQPARLLTPDYDGPGSPPYKLRVRTLGLLYLARQKKILILPPDAQEETFFAEGENDPAGAEERLRKLAVNGLTNLGRSAGKVLRKHQFVKRRPTY